MSENEREGQAIPGHDLSYARLEPEFLRLVAILGRRIRDCESWAPWARLRDKHGWKRLLWAADRAEPGERWPDKIERICMVAEREEASAAKQAIQDAANAEMKEKAKAKARLVKVGDTWVVEEVP